MATPVNCPNCGSTLAPGVMACARCGHRLIVEPAEEPAPVAGPQFPRPATAAPPPAASLDLQQMLADIRARWGVVQTPIFTAAIALAAAALLIATFAHISYTTAAAAAVNRKLNDQVWFTLATGCALAAAALLVLVRFQSGPPRPAPAKNPDLRVALGLAGLTALFALVGLIIGLGGRFDASDSWLRYAQVFAFLALGWLVISRPIPSSFGTVTAVNAGLIIGGLAMVALLIGQFMGLSNNNDTYVGGLSWQALGIAGITLAFGWFLGMRPKGE